MNMHTTIVVCIVLIFWMLLAVPTTLYIHNIVHTRYSTYMSVMYPKRSLFFFYTTSYYHK